MQQEFIIDNRINGKGLLTCFGEHIGVTKLLHSTFNCHNSRLAGRVFDGRASKLFACW